MSNENVEKVIFWLKNTDRRSSNIDMDIHDRLITRFLYGECRWKVEFMAGWPRPVRLTTRKAANWEMIESVAVDIDDVTVEDVVDAICSLAEDHGLDPGIFRTGKGNYRIFTEQRFGKDILEEIL